MQERPRTPQQHLADVLLGDDGPLEEFIRSRRELGLSWRKLARELYEATGRQVDVTAETLRTWFPDRERVAS